MFSFVAVDWFKVRVSNKIRLKYDTDSLTEKVEQILFFSFLVFFYEITMKSLPMRIGPKAVICSICI